jgi:hypothetical protein
MKSKTTSERVPFRRGHWEETTLQWLGALQSPHVPALSSDNQWLRFAVRVLAELTQLSGARSLTFQVGKPGGESTALRAIGAPAIANGSGTSEARLRHGEARLLDQLQRTLEHASRSATLRHALFACRQVCESVARGHQVWIEQNGQLLVLPSLLDMAAHMEQGSGGPVVLLGSDLRPQLQPPVNNVPETRTGSSILCGLTHLDQHDKRQLCADRPTHFMESDALLQQLGADVLCIQAAPPSAEIDAPIRIVLQKGREPRSELVQPRAQSLSHHAPKPPGESDGLEELVRFHGAWQKPSYSNS